MKPMIQRDSLSGGVIFQIRIPLQTSLFASHFSFTISLESIRNWLFFASFSGIWKSGQQKNADLTEFVYEFCFLTSLHGFCLASFKF